MPEWVIVSGAGGGTGGSGARFAEIPTGTLNGTNKVFTLSHAPLTGSLVLTLNIIQTLGQDFTLSGSTITFTVAPKSRDAGWFYAEYLY